MVARTGNVVPAPHVHPFHFGQHIPELLFHRIQGLFQIIRILFAQGVEMDPVQELHQIRSHPGIPLGPGGPHPAAGGTGIVDGVAFLGGTFRIDPEPHTFPGLFGHGAIGFQLPGRIEHNVIRHLADFFHPVGPAEHVDFLPRHGFPAQLRLIEAAGFGARQVRFQHRVQVVVGKSLLGQEDPAARPVLYPFQNLPVPAESRLVQDVAGGAQPAESGLRCFPLQARKGGTVLPHLVPVHYFTSAGSWDSLRGRPCLSRASRKGSGSNSSTVWTPGVVHLPVSSIRAPHMAGTPVV